MRSSPDRTAVLSLWALAGLLSGCAKTGDPHPPLVRVARPPSDLRARQRGSEVVLSLTLPTLHTDGSAVEDLGIVELFRRDVPRSGGPAPLDEAGFLEGAVRLVEQRIDPSSASVRDGVLTLGDPLALAAPAASFGRSFRYAVRFVNNRNQTAGLSNQAALTPVPVPLPPADLAAQVVQDAVRLRWTPPRENEIGGGLAVVASYNVYRSEAGQPDPERPLNPEPLRTPAFEDRAFEFDHPYRYRVSALAGPEGGTAESRRSPALELRPRDTFPPGAPGNLDAVAEGGIVFLLWTAPPDGDLAGYRVYRQVEGAEAAPLATELVTAPSFRDEKAPPGKRVRYRVTAVDRSGNEGPPASAVVDVP